MTKDYTIVPLDKLDVVRHQLRKALAQLPDRYTIRTFYLGPRRKSWTGTDYGTTAKADATGAKIAVYQHDIYMGDGHRVRYSSPRLMAYL